MELITLLNPEGVTEEVANTYRVREAARAVVTDAEGNIALLHVATKHYYKLPGGGLEGEENRLIALERECEEEIGCDITLTDEIGHVIEWRKMFELKQISYCYRAIVAGAKREPKFTDGERKDGFVVCWLPYEEALALLKKTSTDNPEGKLYIVPRDIAILEAVR